MGYFVFTYEDWVLECEKRNMKVVTCNNCDEKCDHPEDCIHGRSIALTEDGRIDSHFKHLMKYGAFYD